MLLPAGDIIMRVFASALSQFFQTFDAGFITERIVRTTCAATTHVEIGKICVLTVIADFRGWILE